MAESSGRSSNSEPTASSSEAVGQAKLAGQSEGSSNPSQFNRAANIAYNFNGLASAGFETPKLQELSVLELEELFSALSDWEQILKDCPEIVQGTSKERGLRP